VPPPVFAQLTCEPGGVDADLIRREVDDWMSSVALRDLVAHFGGTTRAIADLVTFSRVWDYRGGVLERYDTERINYEHDVDAYVRAAIHTLGLGGFARPRHEAYDHVLILGGGIRVALGRTAYAAQLIAEGLRVGSLAALGSLRPRNELERAEAARLGIGPIATEADMMQIGLQRALGLGSPDAVQDGPDWWLHSWTGHPYDVHALAAASTRSGQRANTADTLLGWASLVGAPKPTDRILLVTNDPYVRLQHCDAIRLLGLEYGCGIETVRLDAASSAEWVRPLSTTELLQEVRSSILAMARLLDSLPEHA
jgi:hypothetical protein